jgi:apolipoprotein N-acyltransferase
MVKVFFNHRLSSNPWQGYDPNLCRWLIRIGGHPYFKPMALNKNPVFRKALIPWYDSKPVCLIMMLLMFLFFYFGLIGISVSVNHDQYSLYVWVPFLLVLLSAVVLLIVAVRLLKRFMGRFQN